MENRINEHSSSPFNCERMYTYLKGFAAGSQLHETQRALVFAREKHSGQRRAGGDPYIVHPLTMACDAVSLGIRDDAMLAAILLHDVCEDCGVAPDELPVGEATRRCVELLTFRVEPGEAKEAAKARYYARIAQNRAATIAKLIDRCHNVSSMAGPFSRERLIAYIDETRRYILPLLHEAKQRYPEDANLFFVLKYHIVSVLDSIEETMRAYGAAPLANDEREGE